METHAGQPITNATTARRVSPPPNPSALYIAGANKGNPKPASDRRQETAASARPKRREIGAMETQERMIPEAA